jgi:hypothetical protein
MIGKYIEQERLEEEVKKGHVRLDPNICQLVGDITPG